MSRNAFREHIATAYKAVPRPPRPATGTALPPLAAPGKGQSSPPPPLTPPPPPSLGLLPGFLSAAHIIPEKLLMPELLVEGLLHRGCKLMIAGGSKSFKSWVLLDLAVSVAAGLKWWGMQCKQGRVLYLNFELMDAFFEDRVLSVCRARHVPPPVDFLYWNLRGHCYDLDVLAKVIFERLAESGPLDLIIVDPVYKALGDLDENSAADMTKLMNLVEVIAVQTGACVAFGSHFSKGNQAAKEAKDRPSGSGVLVRDPDAIVTMTRHSEEHCYVVNSELRYLPPLPEFGIRWTFPVMQPDESLDPRDLYEPGRGEGAGTTPTGRDFTHDDVLACLPHSGAQDTLWRKKVAETFQRSGPAYYAAKAALVQQGLVVKRGNAYFRVNLKFDPPPPPPLT